MGWQKKYEKQTGKESTMDTDNIHCVPTWDYVLYLENKIDSCIKKQKRKLVLLFKAPMVEFEAISQKNAITISFEDLQVMCGHGGNRYAGQCGRELHHQDMPVSFDGASCKRSHCFLWKKLKRKSKKMLSMDSVEHEIKAEDEWFRKKYK